MLQDPLYLSRLNPGAPDPSLVTADGAVVTFDVAPGKSVRVLNPFMGGKATLSISHSESKENKGQITDRTAFRFEVRRTLESGQDVVAQATLTVSSPRNGFDADEVQVLAQIVLGTLSSNGRIDLECDMGVLQRILAGEP